MKKFSSGTSCALFCVVLLAITSKVLAADLSYGIKAGYNLATAETNVAVVEQSKSDRSSYHVGGFLDIDLGGGWSIQPQLLYSGKGVEFDAPDHGHIISMYSIDIPVYVMRTFESGFFLGAGPNFSRNIRGSNKITGAHPFTVYYKFGSEPFDFQRNDFGMNFQAGYQHSSGASISINYLKGIQDGLINGDGTEWSHDVLSLSFGYKFGEK